MANKYDFEGIARAGALLQFTALAASGAAPLTNGILGKFTFFLLVQLNKFLASNGLILLNIGVENVSTIIRKENFDSTLEAAFDAVHGNPDRLTAEEKKEIDDKVISAFDKFVDFGVRNGGPP